MILTKQDLEYIKTTLEWLQENTTLIDHNKTQEETIFNSVANSLNTLNYAISEIGDDSHIFRARVSMPDRIEKFKYKNLRSIPRRLDGCKINNISMMCKLSKAEDVDNLTSFLEVVKKGLEDRSKSKTDV